MTLLLIMGFGLVVVNICTVIVICLVLDKYSLVVSLPEGLMAQESSADSQPAIITAFILQAISGNLMVNSVTDYVLLQKLTRNPL